MVKLAYADVMQEDLKDGDRVTELEEPGVEVEIFAEERPLGPVPVI